MTPAEAAESAVRETRALLELQQRELREHRDEHGEALPRLINVDLNHLLTEIGIVLRHLDADVRLLQRGTVE